jgi:hypothetical protein
MIESLWSLVRELFDYLGANFDPVRDVIDIVLVTIGIYWLLVLIRGTRAFQIMLCMIALLAFLGLRLLLFSGRALGLLFVLRLHLFAFLDFSRIAARTFLGRLLLIDCDRR